MNKFLFTILAFVAATLSAAAAPDWHDDIISTMNSTEDVDRNIVVNRQPTTRVITAANYRYTFKSKSLYASVRAKLLSREPDATSVIIHPGKDGEIIMKFKRGNETRNYSLAKIKGRYQLIISVNEEQAMRQAQQQAQQARQEAQKQAQQARQQAQQARQEAQRQAQIARQEAQKQAREARAAAQKARQEAQQARRQASQSGNTTNSATLYISDSDNNSADIQSVKDALKAAEQQRKKLLRK